VPQRPPSAFEDFQPRSLLECRLCTPSPLTTASLATIYARATMIPRTRRADILHSGTSPSVICSPSSIHTPRRSRTYNFLDFVTLYCSFVPSRVASRVYGVADFARVLMTPCGNDEHWFLRIFYFMIKQAVEEDDTKGDENEEWYRTYGMSLGVGYRKYT
jgi:hypothetical protein